MKNPYKTRQPNNDEVVGYLAYERAMKDAIKMVVKMQNLNTKGLPQYEGFEEARRNILAALKEE